MNGTTISVLFKDCILLIRNIFFVALIKKPKTPHCPPNQVRTTTTTLTARRRRRVRRRHRTHNIQARSPPASTAAATEQGIRKTTSTSTKIGSTHSLVMEVTETSGAVTEITTSLSYMLRVFFF